MTTIDKLDDVQGIVFSGYNKYMACCSYYLLKIDDAAKTKPWLKNLVEQNQISHGADKPTDETENRINLAISYSGLENLNLDKDSLYSFELSFREGMHSEHRSALLGDRGSNDPSTWDWGSGANCIDMLFILFSKNETIHKASQKYHEKAFKGAGLSIVQHLDAGEKKQDANGFTLEHFGFADGISDPIVDGFPTTSGTGEIATGEFLLGYPNQYDGKLTKIPQLGSAGTAFGKNGTYLVLRQLKQDVGKFWAFMEEEAARQGITADYLAAKFVGRWKSGAVVEPNQDSDPNKVDNSFNFSKDPHGQGCPMGSHIRRANPRAVGLGATEEEALKVANRHRILRRGRSYGNFLENPAKDDGQERGLLFICLNANIERQFEFVQHTWINGVKFAGLYDENDPLIGSGVPENRNFTIQDEPLRRRVCGFQQFVTTKGGSYFFLPSLSALGLLGST
ncbi:Dyp-type peroxidase [Methylomonas albis]|uniref:Dyp-type peroxidase n=1 Tax=Methylomonas albis TaxID=1854563 RepID=A0ABR9D4J4_9GAMM|nr:Dyp-type peroxidase [Methylomonas albis]MBD9358052.1 Dyp-type peroxidase [Methylomonas albis]